MTHWLWRCDRCGENHPIEEKAYRIPIFESKIEPPNFATMGMQFTNPPISDNTYCLRCYRIIRDVMGTPDAEEATP